MPREIIQQKLGTMFSATASVQDRTTTAWVLARIIMDQALTEKESAWVSTQIEAVLASDNPAFKLDAQWLGVVMDAYGNGQRGGEKKPAKAAAGLEAGVQAQHPKSLIFHSMLNLGMSAVEQAVTEFECLQRVIRLVGVEECEKGAAYSQLGLMYSKGRGVLSDSLSEAPSSRFFGSAKVVIYEGGPTIGKDNAKAMDCFREGAERGDVAAMRYLGVMYDEGRGVDRDDVEAMRWYRQAAELDDTQAIRLLGVMYSKGQGVEKDEAKAADYYRQAAERGDAAATYNLGVVHQAGRGVEKNPVEAVQWYRRAANLGYAEAAYALGRMYLFGDNVCEDTGQAIVWFNKAAMSGHSRAQHALNQLIKRRICLAAEVTGAEGAAPPAGEGAPAPARGPGAGRC